jgi:hypothetical protein
MADEHQAPQRADTAEEAECLHRRDFLQSLKRWSQAVIGGVVLGALLPSSQAEAGWVNSRGSWVNGHGGGGGWANPGGSWINGGGGWINRGGSWVNGHGGGGGSWVNRRGW